MFEAGLAGWKSKTFKAGSNLRLAASGKIKGRKVNAQLTINRLRSKQELLFEEFAEFIKSMAYCNPSCNARVLPDAQLDECIRRDLNPGRELGRL